MKLRLSDKLFDYLDYNWCKEHDGSCFEQFRKNRVANIVVIEMDEDMADLIYDWANEQLCLKGFDDNYELNNEGKILEEISDLFLIK